MVYNNTVIGFFISRPNRFIAYVMVNGVEEIVHVKNTGRCKELLLPNVKVVLCRSDVETRKTKYDLISVWKENLGWVNIDSQAPNQVVREWLNTQGYTYVKPEYTFGKSRIDFYMENYDEKFLMEVKGCTLEIDGKGYFPDAPTLRGVKHLEELTLAVDKGYHAIMAFVIAMEGVNQVFPNEAVHPEFKQAYEKAIAAGVEVWLLPCRVNENSLVIENDRVNKASS